MRPCILFAMLMLCAAPLVAQESTKENAGDQPSCCQTSCCQTSCCQTSCCQTDCCQTDCCQTDKENQEKQEGFVLLFDGKSFEGWRASDQTPQSWKIENGLLVLTGGNSHLFTKEVFDDFVVRFEWRPAKKGYNSGFFIRGRQIQMAQGGAGMLFGSEGTKAVPKLHKPPGEWNEWEVSCIGPKVSLKVNGKLAWEINDFKPERGPLGIEAEGHAIDFRNLRIKRVQREQHAPPAKEIPR